MSIKSLLLTLLCVTLYANSAWSLYKERFIQADGRVIDRKNSDITHTEAIGYTLFFAQHFHDKALFEKVFRWYKNNIKKNGASLPGWKWGKCDDGRWKMCDMNSASDGDLWIAYALFLMFEQTKEPRYIDEAQQLVAQIKKHLFYTLKDELYLLPGENGFQKAAHVTLNPSYMLFEIFTYLQKHDDALFWKRVEKGALSLLERSRFGILRLHPDWCVTDTEKGGFALRNDKTKFGYDAIRIPLNILRSALSKKEKERLLQPYREYVAMMRYHPLGSVALADESISLNDLSYGHIAVYIAVGEYFGMDVALLKKNLQERMNEEHDDYYAHCLFIFSSL